MAGPGDKLKTIERIKPNREIQSPKNEDLIIAILRLCALSRPNKVGVDNKAITRITPTADIELTITSAVVKLRARFNKETFIPLAEAPSGSNPTYTTFSYPKVINKINVRKAIIVLNKSLRFAVNKSPNNTASKSILIPRSGMSKTPKPSIPARIVFITAS